jgi:hypothetical protein
MKKVISCMVILLSVCAAPAIGAVVYANNAIPGDDFTNATSTTSNITAPGAAVDSTGWYYNNVRNNGHVGINTNLARSGNGSVWFNAVQGPSGASSKADIEYYNVVGGASQSLGKLGNLTSFSYDWYRQSGGTASTWLNPVLRMYVSDGTHSGYLVFEREINRDTFGNPVVAPVDTWTTDNVLGGNYRLWSTGSTLPFNLNGTNGTAKYYDALHISEWILGYGNYDVYGISAGVGSGWGTFQGAVDNISFGFGGANTTYNFEVVPEPMTLALLGLGGLVLRRRK